MMSNCICVVLFFLVGIARNSALVTNTNTNYKANYLRQHCSSFSTARRFSTNSLSLDRSRAVTIDTNTKTSITTQTIRSLTGRTTSKTKRLTTALASKYSPLDSNRNGRIDFKEVLDIPEEIIQSSQLLQNFMRSFKSFLSGKYLKNTTFLTIIQKLVNPIDLFLMTFIFYFHKRFLRWLYTITHRNNKKSYEDSFIGHLQGPITIFVSIPPILLATDFVNAILKYSGLQNLVKTDITKVAPPVCYAVFIGQVITNLKDYYFQLARERMKKPRDLGKEGLTDELTSTVIWLIVAAFCLENLSLEVGLGVGSIFAVGGIGSASIVLALRSTFENVVGGILLKFQDKFRVGENISVPSRKVEGEVFKMNYINTQVIQVDNSIVEIPNQEFTKGAVINWSRTPYRQFKTSYEIREQNFEIVQEMIKNVRNKLIALPEVESVKRAVLVSSSGFNRGSNNIIIDIECHLRAKTDVQLAERRTKVVDTIATILDDYKKK